MNKSFPENLREALVNLIHDLGNDTNPKTREETIELSLPSIIELVEELIGEPEYRETDDMSLNSWTPEDYKAFGRNRLRNELKAKLRGTKDE